MRSSLLLVFMTVFCVNMSHAQAYYPVKAGGKWGLIDASGKIFLDPVYDAVGMFDGQYAIVQKGTKVGLISRKGEEVVTPRFEEVAVLDSALFAVFDDGRWKMTDGRKILLDVDPDRLEIREGGFVGVLKNGLWGVALYDGKLIIEPGIR